MVLNLVEPEKGIYDRKHVKDEPFGTWLQKAVVTPPKVPVTFWLEPADAAEVLKYNDANRPYSRRHAERLAAEMKAGRWHFTGQPIIFSDKGRLIDGQHRMGACVEAGVPIKCILTFGVPDAAFAHIDVGKKRTASDIFAINGVKDSALVSAAMAALLTMHKPHKDTYLTSAQLYEVYKSHADISDSTWAGRAIHKQRLMQPALGVALHYAFALKSRGQADDFFHKLSEGVGLKAKDPIKKLRDKLIENLSRDEKMSRRRIAALTIKAWGFYRRGQPTTQLKFGEDEAFPKVQ